MLHTPPELDFYVCAPAPLLESIQMLLIAAGVRKGHLRLEPVRNAAT